MSHSDLHSLTSTLATLAESVRLAQEGIRGIEAGLAVLRQALEGAPAVASRLPRRSETFELVINRRRSRATESEIEAINPADFDLFLDLVYLRLSIKRGGKAVVRPLRDTGLRRGELDVLRLLMERQGRPVTNLSIQDREHDPLEPQTMRKIIYRLRGELGGKGHGDKLIVTESRAVRQSGEGFGYLIPVRVRTCLIRPAQLNRTLFGRTD